MTTQEKNIYWIPLLENHNNKIKWSGKALPLPLSYDIKVTKEPIWSSLIGDKPIKYGLFVKLNEEGGQKSQSYLLGINNIFKAPITKNLGIAQNFNNSEKESQILLKEILNNKISNEKFRSPRSGMQVKLSGRLGGVNKKMRMAVSTGRFKPQSFSSRLDYADSDVYTKWGTLGLKVYMN